MAKRFTDSEKWKDDWYISLSNDYKIVWQWLIDNCSHSGLCKRSISLLNIMCKTSVKENEIIEKMEGRLIVVDDFWFIPKFIKFQYSTLLSSKPAIISVVKDLFKYKLITMIPESFGNDYKIKEKSFENHCKMIKDKDKDKVMDKDKDNKGIGEKKIGINFSEDGEFVFFEDGSKQKLGVDQKGLFDMNELKPKDILKGSIY